MKRIVTLLCMIACVLCLAGCNGKEAVSEFQQQKIDMAKNTSSYMFEVLVAQSKQDTIDFVGQLTKEEAELLVSDTFKIPLENGGEEGIKVDGGSFKGMLISFQKGLEEIGEIDRNAMGEAEARVDKHQIIVEIPVVGSKSEGTAEFVISNDTFQRVEGAALNPKKTFGQMMQKAGLNTVIGMGTVFAMLLFMSILISCFRIVPAIMGQGKKEKETQANTGIQNAVTQIEANEAVADEADDCELVAVIAAAIAAFEGSASTDGFVVRSIRKRNK